MLLVVVLTVLSLSLIAVMPEPASASIPKPSVPEFTVKFVDHSYDEPATYSIDPYTGENVTHAGQHIENRSIEVTIKNQPFTSYRNENGSIVGLFYNIRVKGHFENWTGEPTSENYIYRSDSEYSVKSYTLSENGLEITGGDQVDFQVEALIGYYTRVYGAPVPPFMESYHDVFTGETSSWSNNQTLTIPASNSSSALQLEAIVGTVIIAGVLFAGLLVYFKKRKR